MAETVGKTGGADRTAVVRDLADVPADAREDALQGVTDLLARAAAADGVEALGEAFVRGLTEDRGHRHGIAVTPPSCRRWPRRRARTGRSTSGPTAISPGPGSWPVSGTRGSCGSC